MAGVAEDRLILHDTEVLLGNDVLAPCHSHKNVAVLSCLVHRHDAESVHGRVECLERIDLSHDDVRAHTLGPHSGSLAAPSVAGNNNGLACDDQISRVHDRCPYRLTRAILVIIIMLRLRIVDGHHRAGQDSFLLPGFQSMDSRCGLLTASDQAVCIFAAFASEQIDEVTAVIYDEVRMAGERLGQEIFVFLRGYAVFAIRLDAHLRNGRCHVILCRERVTAGQIYFRAALCENQTEVGSLSLQMHGDRDAESLERFRLFELLLNTRKSRHEGAYPLNLFSAFGCKLLISYITHVFFSLMIRLPLLYIHRRFQSQILLHYLLHLKTHPLPIHRHKLTLPHDKPAVYHDRIHLRAVCRIAE